jgi:hypothetical protein
MVAIAEGRSRVFETSGRVHQIRTALAETVWNVSHLKRTLDQKRTVNPKEAKNWLYLFYSAIHQQPNEFSFNGEVPKLGSRRASGFWFTVYPFEVSGRKFVLKVGHEFSPVYGQPGPSSQEFFFAYKRNLQRQRETFDPFLPYLIPPQELAFLNDGSRSTTLIAQPDDLHGEKFADFKALSSANQGEILTEYDTFIALSQEMQKTTGLTPDLLFENFMVGMHNLVIGQTTDGPHLILLDNGLIDTTREAPILNALGRFASTFWPAFEKARMQTIQRRSNHL